MIAKKMLQENVSYTIISNDDTRFQPGSLLNIAKLFEAKPQFCLYLFSHFSSFGIRKSTLKRIGVMDELWKPNLFNSKQMESSRKNLRGNLFDGVQKKCSTRIHLYTYSNTSLYFCHVDCLLLPTSQSQNWAELNLKTRYLQVLWLLKCNPHSNVSC